MASFLFWTCSVPVVIRLAAALSLGLRGTPSLCSCTVSSWRRRKIDSSSTAQVLRVSRSWQTTAERIGDWAELRQTGLLLLRSFFLPNTTREIKFRLRSFFIHNNFTYSRHRTELKWTEMKQQRSFFCLFVCSFFCSFTFLCVCVCDYLLSHCLTSFYFLLLSVAKRHCVY